MQGPGATGALAGGTSHELAAGVVKMSSGTAFCCQWDTFINVVGYETSVEPLDANTFRYANDTLLKLRDGTIFPQTDVATLKRQS